MEIYDDDDELIASDLKAEAAEEMEVAADSYKNCLINFSGAAACGLIAYISKKYGEQWPTETYDYITVTGVLGFVGLGHLSEAVGPHYNAWRKNRKASRIRSEIEAESI